MEDSAASRHLTTVLTLTYPVLAHVAVARDSAGLTVAAMALLALLALLPALARGRLFAWAVAPLVITVCWWLASTPLRAVPMYMPPVLIPAFMAWVFGRTLMGGRTPLIEQLVRLLHPPQTPPDSTVWPYARRLTAAWTALFIMLATTNLLLAALAAPNGLLLAAGMTPPLTVPRQWSSLFANVLGYLLVAGFFVIEYAYRRYRFPQQPYRNMFEFLARMRAVLPQLTGRVKS